MSLFSRDKTFAQPINLTITLFLGLFHVCAVVALLMFSWKALLFALVMWWIAESPGIGMGFHRLLTHRGISRFTVGDAPMFADIDDVDSVYRMVMDLRDKANQFVPAGVEREGIRIAITAPRVSPLK